LRRVHTDQGTAYESIWETELYNRYHIEGKSDFFHPPTGRDALGRGVTWIWRACQGENFEREYWVEQESGV